MFNPYDLFPKNIDPNLRLFLIILVTVQVLAFIAYIGLLIYDHRRVKKDPTVNPYTDINVESNKEKED
jgi:hypothetical protein